MSTRHPASIESRARRLATKVDHRQLLEHAEMLQGDGKRAAAVFWRALEIQKEDRVLESSLTLTEMMNGAVYCMSYWNMRSYCRGREPPRSQFSHVSDEHVADKSYDISPDLEINRFKTWTFQRFSASLEMLGVDAGETPA